MPVGSRFYAHALPADSLNIDFGGLDIRIEPLGINTEGKQLVDQFGLPRVRFGPVGRSANDSFHSSAAEKYATSTLPGFQPCQDQFGDGLRTVRYPVLCWGQNVEAMGESGCAGGVYSRRCQQVPGLSPFVWVAY